MKKIIKLSLTIATISLSGCSGMVQILEYTNCMKNYSNKDYCIGSSAVNFPYGSVGYYNQKYGRPTHVIITR